MSPAESSPRTPEDVLIQRIAPGEAYRMGRHEIEAQVAPLHEETIRNLDEGFSYEYRGLENKLGGPDGLRNLDKNSDEYKFLLSMNSLRRIQQGEVSIEKDENEYALALRSVRSGLDYMSEKYGARIVNGWAEFSDTDLEARYHSLYGHLPNRREMQHLRVLTNEILNDSLMGLEAAQTGFSSESKVGIREKIGWWLWGEPRTHAERAWSARDSYERAHGPIITPYERLTPAERKTFNAAGIQAERDWIEQESMRSIEQGLEHRPLTPEEEKAVRMAKALSEGDLRQIMNQAENLYQAEVHKTTLEYREAEYLYERAGTKERMITVIEFSTRHQEFVSSLYDFRETTKENPNQGFFYEAQKVEDGSERVGTRWVIESLANLRGSTDMIGDLGRKFGITPTGRNTQEKARNTQGEVAKRIRMASEYLLKGDMDREIKALQQRAQELSSAYQNLEDLKNSIESSHIHNFNEFRSFYNTSLTFYNELKIQIEAGLATATAYQEMGKIIAEIAKELEGPNTRWPTQRVGHFDRRVDALSQYQTIASDKRKEAIDDRDQNLIDRKKNDTITAATNSRTRREGKIATAQQQIDLINNTYTELGETNLQGIQREKKEMEQLKTEKQEAYDKTANEAVEMKAEYIKKEIERLMAMDMSQGEFGQGLGGYIDSLMTDPIVRRAIRRGEQIDLWTYLLGWIHTFLSARTARAA